MKKTLIPLLAATLMTASWPMLSTAQTDTAPAVQSRAADSRVHGRAMMGHRDHGAMMRSGMKHDHGSARGWLRGLDLSETQRDRVFEIMHAQAPKMREQRKAVQAARAELAKLGTAAQLDAAQLQAASTKLAQATAAMAESRIRTRNAIFQLLTPEQKQKIEARLTERQGHGRKGERGMHGHGHSRGHGGAQGQGPAHLRS